MKKLMSLIEELENLEKEKFEVSKPLAFKILNTKTEIKELFLKEFSADVNLKTTLEKLEATSELTSVEHDEFFHQWVRFDASKTLPNIKDVGPVVYNLALEAFNAFIQDACCAYFDEKNDCLTACIGPAILINHEGEILDQDSGTWIVKKNTFSTIEERNEFIESYMEKTGVYPWIISCDYYGNAKVVNTQAKRKTNENKKQ